VGDRTTTEMVTLLSLRRARLHSAQQLSCTKGERARPQQADQQRDWLQRWRRRFRIKSEVCQSACRHLLHIRRRPAKE
jgi:hypothetical protein